MKAQMKGVKPDFVNRESNEIPMKTQEKEDEDVVTLNEILVNEGLMRQDVSRAKARWRIAVQKLNTLMTERHFNDSRVQIDLSGFIFKIIDNSDKKKQPVSLLSI